MARYTLTIEDGQPTPVDLDAFLADNADWLGDDPEARDEILALEPGESYSEGGGAAVGWTLTRVDCGYEYADECHGARERSVAGFSNEIPACPDHGPHPDMADGRAA